LTQGFKVRFKVQHGDVSSVRGVRWPLRFNAWSRKAALLAVLVGSVATTACSPVFNWREVGLGDSGLAALLPCKPDRATRNVVFDGDDVTLQMAGCEAGGATFTLAYTVAHDAAQATAWLAIWKSTMEKKLQASAPAATTMEMRGAASIPAAIQLAVERNASTGSKTSAKIWWFAQTVNPGRSGDVILYQAMVLGQPDEPNAIATFFESLHLP